MGIFTAQLAQIHIYAIPIGLLSCARTSILRPTSPLPRHRSLTGAKQTEKYSQVQMVTLYKQKWKEEKRKAARLEKLTNKTTKHIKAREGANIEDTRADSLQSRQEVWETKISVSLTLWIFSFTTGYSLSPKLVVKTRMQASNNCTSHLPQMLPYLFSQFVSHRRGPQHNEFWQLKTTPKTRSSQDISDSCLRATSFKSRCFPSALPTTQTPLASVELMLWSFVLSVQLRSLSWG